MADGRVTRLILVGLVDVSDPHGVRVRREHVRDGVRQGAYSIGPETEGVAPTDPGELINDCVNHVGMRDVGRDAQDERDEAADRFGICGEVRSRLSDRDEDLA